VTGARKGKSIPAFHKDGWLDAVGSLLMDLVDEDDGHGPDITPDLMAAGASPIRVSS
jgi:hypothetical protein